MIADFLWRFFAVFFGLALCIAWISLRNAADIREANSFNAGFRRGRERGRDEGWLARNQELLDYERARRARDGKFRSVRKGVDNG